MKKLSFFKKINFLLLTFALLITLGIYGYFYLGYCIDSCSHGLIVGLLNPTFNYFLGLAVISGFFLLLPSRFFKQWILIVLPIATILIVLHASDVSVNTSGILNMSRSEVVRFDMLVLIVTSLLFVVGVYVKEKMMKKKSTNKK